MHTLWTALTTKSYKTVAISFRKAVITSTAFFLNPIGRISFTYHFLYDGNMRKLSFFLNKLYMKSFIGSLLVILFALYHCSATGQTLISDSLEIVMQYHKTNDTTKVNIINQLAYATYTRDQSKTRSYAIQGYELAKELGYTKGQAESLWLQGITYVRQDPGKSLGFFENALDLVEKIGHKQLIGKYTNAIGTVYGVTGGDSLAICYYQKAIDIATETNDLQELGKYLINLSQLYNRRGKVELAIQGYNAALNALSAAGDKLNMATIYNSLGNIYTTQGNYPLALECFQNGLEIREARQEMNAVARSLVSIGGIYFTQKNYPKALEYNERALKIADSLNDRHTVAGSLLNIGLVYLNTDNQEALEYFQKALEVSKDLRIVPLQIGILLNIGQYFNMQADNNKALENFKVALELSEASGNKPSTSKAKYQLARIYFNNGQFTRALSYAQSSLDIASIIKLIEIEKDLHKLLAEIHAATNNYKKAYAHSLLYNQLSDSIFNESNVRQIAELEYTYKFEKEKQAIELEQQKKDALQAAKRRQQHSIIISLTICFLLVSLLSVYIYRLYRFKHKANILLTKQKYEIQELNEELVTLNEELTQSNEHLYLAKEEIQERENLLTMITDNVPAFISLLDNNQQYVFANSGYAKQYGQNKVDMLGKSVDTVVDKDYADRAKANFTRAFNGEVVHFENYIESGNKRNYVHTSYLPYYFNSNLRGVLVCSFDITERKMAEQAMLEIEQEKKRLLEQEIERINWELEQNQKSLTAASLKLIQNSERDADTVRQLQTIENNTNPEGKRTIQTLISDFKRISSASNWDEFELLFQKVHSSFYEKLNEQFPNLSGNERKLCAFLKLSMSSKDIANITFQSEEALKKARQRLRQKLGIDRDTNLVTYLQNI